MGAFCQVEGRNQFPKFEFSRQKQGNHRVGDGLEVSGSEFWPDWPVGGRAVAIWMFVYIFVYISAVCLHFGKVMFLFYSGSAGGVMYQITAISVHLGPG